VAFVDDEKFSKIYILGAVDLWTEGVFHCCSECGQSLFEFSCVARAIDVGEHIFYALVALSWVR